MTADDAAKNGIAGRGPSGARSSRPRQRAGATIYAPQFIGRTRELAALAAEMDRARAGEFRVALVSGTAGVGKTRLAAEISDRNAQGAVALSARAYRWGEATSYGVWIEALDRHLRTLPAEEIRRLCGGSIATLASILASVGSVAGVPDREPGRGRILEALVEFFDRASRERPVFVLLDDMHLADASSWEALRYLARRLPAAPIGIVATARAGELHVNPIAVEVLSGLTADGLLTRWTLEPLPSHETAELVREVLRTAREASWAVPEALVRWLQERALGHPLFVIGLLRALLEEEADLTHPRLVRLPEALRDRVDLDLQVLDARDQRVLEALAVVDGRIDPVVLSGIAGCAMPELGEILERLCRAGFVAESGAGTDLRYEVAHPIIQVAVYDAIGGTRRRALHRTVAEMLLASGALGLAAMHYARSGERGDAEAVRVLCRALRQAEDRGVYQEALTILGALLDILPEGDSRWLDVLDAMAWQADWVLSHLAEGDTTVAVRAMEQVRGPADEAGDPRAQAAVRFYLASFLSFGLCELDQAIEECRAAIELFERAGEIESELLATNELAWIQGCAGNLAADADLALEVCVRADTAGYPRVKILAAGTAGYALGMLGRFDEAEVWFGQSIDLAEVEGSTYRLAWSRAQLGAIRSMRGPLDDAIASVEASLDADLAAPDALALENMAQCTWLNGRLESALSWLDQSAVRRPVNGSRRRAWGQALAARLHAEMGHPARAEELIGSAKSAYADSDLLTWSVWCWWKEGVLAWIIGDAGRSSAALDRALRRLADMGAVPLEALVLADVAEIAADAGDVDRAAASAARSVVASGACGGVLAPALARLAVGWSDLAGGRPEAVIEPAGQVAAVLSSAGYRFHAAIASSLLARATEQHDRATAVERLRDAAESFEACGALWRRDRTLRRLAHLGSRGRVAAAAGRGPESLTDRERDVALLARRGYTAKEIGERLFIGRRTVESHLQTIYSKLGVRSKRDLVRYLDDVGFH